MRGLTIIVAEAAPSRFRVALNLAAAQAALSGQARLFLDGRAVALLRVPLAAPDDDGYAAAGLPTIAELFEEALGLGVGIVACQSGLALTGTDAAALDPRIELGGVIGVLQQLGDGRLVMA